LVFVTGDGGNFEKNYEQPKKLNDIIITNIKDIDPKDFIKTTPKNIHD